jgi:hypothetical protein
MIFTLFNVFHGHICGFMGRKAKQKIMKTGQMHHKIILEDQTQLRVGVVGNPVPYSGGSMLEFRP